MKKINYDNWDMHKIIDHINDLEEWREKHGTLCKCICHSKLNDGDNCDGCWNEHISDLNYGMGKPKQDKHEHKWFGVNNIWSKCKERNCKAIMFNSNCQIYIPEKEE